MKKTILLFISMFLTLMSQATVSLIVASTAGGLSTAITTAGGNLNTVTNLTITGTIDARDFVTMYNMPVLAELDLAGVNIADFTGTNGTVSGSNVYPANAIPTQAFRIGKSGKATLTSVTLPSTITSIGSMAFQYCFGITSITIPSSVSIIGSAAFENCQVLKTLTFSGMVTTIESLAFNGCSGLTGNLVLPSQLTTIGVSAFSGCGQFSSVLIPASVSSIGASAFKGFGGPINVDAGNANYSSSSEGILFNKTKTSLIQCPVSITGAYTIPTTVNSMEDGSFNGCTGLTSVTLPNIITSIGNFVFNWCINLNSVSIPESVTSIGNNSFSDCRAFTSITIPASVRTIGTSAFSGCWLNQTVSIPASVTSIGNGAFDGCIGFVTVDANNPNYSSKDGVLFNKDQTRLIHCRVVNLRSYSIPSTVKTIGYNAFSQCWGLNSVIIPASVTSIEEYGFYYCQDLTSITSLSVTPLNLGATYNVFGNINKTTCILYVPENSINDYKATLQWKNFVNIVGLTTAVPTLPTASIALYPNPVTDIFQITGFEGSIDISISDLQGRILQNNQIKQNEFVSLKNFAKGIYIVKSNNGNSAFERKIIKN